MFVLKLEVDGGLGHDGEKNTVSTFTFYLKKKKNGDVAYFKKISESLSKIVAFLSFIFLFYFF